MTNEMIVRAYVKFLKTGKKTQKNRMTTWPKFKRGTSQNVGRQSTVGTASR